MLHTCSYRSVFWYMVPLEQYGEDNEKSLAAASMVSEKNGENITDLPYHISDSFGQNRLQVAVKRQVEFSFFDIFDRRKVKHSQLTWTITQPEQHEDKKRLLSRWNRNEVEARWKALFLTSLTWNPDDGDNKFKQLSNENKITNTL